MQSVCKIGANAWRLCVCLPLHNASIYRQMLMGQIAQNRCYTLARKKENKNLVGNYENKF